MQIQGMNQFGNRGFGGPPQPQRQGGRRGNRGGAGGGGGFRNSRFDQQRNLNQNQGQGGHRPNIDQNKPQNVQQPVQQQKPQQAPPQEQKPPQQQQQKPPQQSPQQPPPLIQQQPKPQLQQQQPKPQQQPQQQPKPQLQPKPQQQPNNQQKPEVQTVTPQNVRNQDSQDKVDKVVPELNQNQFNNQHQQRQNQNGNMGGVNRQGGWGGQGGPRRDGSFQPQGNRGPKFGGGQGQGQGQGHGQGQGQGQGQMPPRNNQARGNRPPLDGKQMDRPREEVMLANKLKDLTGPILDLPPLEQGEVKFNGRSRLYIGNLTNDVTEEEILNLFKPFGEAAELFINKEKGFGFIKMDYRVNAEKAKHELDGKQRNGKPLRVRFAPHNSAVHVKNLPPFVSNELLYKSFEIFGKIERAYVRVDERGKSLGDAVVEFARKPSAMAAIRNCGEKCFFLTSSLRPVIVENFEEPDELDGLPEKNLPKKHPEFLKAREFGPRFSEAGSFEHEYGTRWKQLHELHRQKEEALKKELSAEEEKLEAQMEYAKYEHETEILREQLRQREQDRERQKRTWEMAERAADERREAERAQLLMQEEELSNRMRLQDDELRRRQQENTLFVQAQRLSSMLDRQEQGMFEHQKPMDGGFRDQYDQRGGFDDTQQNRGGWDGGRQDDYPNKRRRY